MGLAETLKALTHPIWREILELLKSERLPAGDITGHFDVAGATISHHLNILKKAGLVVEIREIYFFYYELSTSVLEDIMTWLADLKGESGDED